MTQPDSTNTPPTTDTTPTTTTSLVTSDPKEVVTTGSLPPEQVDQAKKLASEFDIRENAAIEAFGMKAESSSARASDQMLQRSTRSSGVAGEVLSEMMGELRAVNANTFSGEVGGFMAHLPIIGRGYREVRDFVSGFESVARKVDKMKAALQEQRGVLVQDNATLEVLREQAVADYQQFLIYIAAGETKLTEAQIELARMRQEAAGSNDQMKVQDVSDFAADVDRLDRRIGVLRQAAMLSLLLNPQCRQIQEGNNMLVERIQTAINITIPLWTNYIVMAITLYDQKKGLELSRAVDTTTNELVARSSAMLKENSIAIAKETQEGIVRMETLHKATDDLVATIDGVLQANEAGRQLRITQAKEIEQMQMQLQAKQLEAKSAALKQA